MPVRVKLCLTRPKKYRGNIMEMSKVSNGIVLNKNTTSHLTKPKGETMLFKRLHKWIVKKTSGINQF